MNQPAPASPVMQLLAAGVPLTLLCDLVSTRPPPSAEIATDDLVLRTVIELGDPVHAVGLESAI